MEVYAVGFSNLSLSVLVLFLMPRLRRLVVVWETVTSLINQSLFGEKQISVLQSKNPSKNPHRCRTVKPIPMVLRGHAATYLCSQPNVLAERLTHLSNISQGNRAPEMLRIGWGTVSVSWYTGHGGTQSTRWWTRREKRQGRGRPWPREHPFTGRFGCQSRGQLSASAAEGIPSHAETLPGSNVVDSPSLLCRDGGRRNKGEEPFVQPLAQQSHSTNINVSWKSNCCFLKS